MWKCTPASALESPWEVLRRLLEVAQTHSKIQYSWTLETWVGKCPDFLGLSLLVGSRMGSTVDTDIKSFVLK